ncbi:MAG: UDP-N-acetylmuramoyl-tripeptide--D-alanyl-D-alanine ligase [Pseudanabaena sp.]|jgi:UDP-N-acetylmuramoyl-tripeptide--D-alanyl-D-alanine ligase|uniref:UDP-N-acetylmuramoyl-tripeptide--D-alanyl-D- alanine ligase n=1 Tax=Pseudanabaena mucicola TaxID=71190 RepID=UPI002574DBF3|nr:UDP-N-acetylmuramoyl-tripeptide--D-alanyl-D-alanine ligase [Pseudanabaena mucicola]MCA6571712.1 UDP-N-acetylmuramoyl-tripeptide--D-alanyl-D-alanine ligase [Pseudanabaena sp. M53BS1SP1A06MG]MCA6581793.1 UDP-N-acetylmuramoyl-tripeptide--D-alanyl-D-alanine ligase [Pseudanabaena sp. M34BS1SP1A06MG]MCA6585684.1 UDP-N-acetylmuramoyl-tripeptide--D-alanyl-D-alanine ligase [Pseudanabaena sp. M051S1SP1A06QC]MCA6591929.1 UDP-N-acetylmuramoyl-tripeptide--D-alanyl-D-alanine ligase [Pseudanabaena sp. M38B
MTRICTISKAISITSATVANIDETAQKNIEIFGIVSDSRKLKTGELFVALTGENFDGHGFVAAAIAQGAVAAIVSHEWAKSEAAKGLPVLAVRNTLTAYQDLARWWRTQFQQPVISVTGSVGKTTTKEIIASMLACYVSPHKQVHKSQANHNNDIGVAQTLLAIAPEQHDFVVVEMGMRGLGEIERLARTALPTVSVITNVGTAHIGRLGSREAIAQAKCELLAETPTDGTAILNASNPLLLEMASKVWQGKTITYGLGVGDINGELIGDRLQVGNLTWDLPLPGRHNALNFLAGLAVLKALNLDWQQTTQGIGKLDLPFGRAQLYQLPHDVVILDETYNASPEGMLAALRQLSDMPAKRHWVVLGTMKELGEMSTQLHRQVGQSISNLGIEGAIVLADGEADAILAGANGSLEYAIACHSYEDITQTLLQKVKSGDRILFKASRSVGMDRVVEAFRKNWQ